MTEPLENPGWPDIPAKLDVRGLTHRPHYGADQDDYLQTMMSDAYHKIVRRGATELERRLLIEDGYLHPDAGELVTKIRWRGSLRCRTWFWEGQEITADSVAVGAPDMDGESA
ncbi:MAG: hypothetical protein WAV90_15835 [Gordonia amarae]